MMPVPFFELQLVAAARCAGLELIYLFIYLFISYRMLVYICDEKLLHTSLENNGKSFHHFRLNFLKQCLHVDVA